MPVIPRFRPFASGFTLPELVATLVIIGILAAVAAPRFLTRSEFDVFGFTEQTRAALRFAQKSAIAKHRKVCVSIAGNALSASFAPVFKEGVDVACDASYPLREPAGGENLGVAAVNGINITPTNFSFDALGRPSAGQVLSVSGGSSTRTITVEAETGYVH